jgi:hypothetical protein
MSIRRWLPWIVALGVLAVTMLVVLNIPASHSCLGASRPVFDPIRDDWVCRGSHSNLLIPVEAHTDQHLLLQLGILLGGLALAVALGVAVHKAYPPAPEPGADINQATTGTAPGT